MRRYYWIAVTLGALLALVLIGGVLAEPPTPAAPKPAPPAGTWDGMRSWMDSNFGQGFFDKMHGSAEGMVETCNTMMGSGGMMGGGSMMGGTGGWGGMMGGTGGWGGMMGGTGNWEGMMGSGPRPSSQGRYGGMLGSGSWGSRSGWGGMMGNFMGAVRNMMLPSIFY